FRNFDGRGGRFLDWSVSTESAPGVSFFASRDEATHELVGVILNLSPDHAVEAQIDVGTCGVPAKYRSYGYRAGEPELAERTVAAPVGRVLGQELPPWSITVIDVPLSGAKAANPAPAKD
ncbi:MAG TPA: hypothetical protein VGK73_01300, partial [Polyangiaceae bacterium]